MNSFAKYQQVIGEINWYAFLAFIAVLPYGHSLSRPIWMIWLISWLLECRFINKPLFLRPESLSVNNTPSARTAKDLRRILIPYIGLAVWFLWGVVSLFWAENKAAADGALMRNFDLFFLLFPALWGVNERYNWQTCLKVLLYTSLVSVFVYLFVHFWVINYRHALNSSQPFRLQYDLHTLLTLENITLFMKHRLQYVSILCLSIPALLLLVRHNLPSLGKVRAAIFTTLALLIVIITVYWTRSREGLINIIVLLSTALIFLFPPHRRWLGVITMLVLAAALFVALVRFHPRFNEVPLRQYFQITDNKALPSREPRFSIWYAALENPRDYSLYGKGVGQCADYLVKQYERHDWPVHIERRFHSHNQYLCTWIEFGFLAMLLFIALWLTVPFVFKGNAQIFAVFFTETLMLNMLTENMLSGIEGIFFTATGMLILLVLTYRAPASPS